LWLVYLCIGLLLFCLLVPIWVYFDIKRHK
jgi:hypothetical protein